MSENVREDRIPVRFFRGLKKDYRPGTDHLDGLYFTTDTQEILMSDSSEKKDVSTLEK